MNILDTERLRLRTIEEGDAPFYLELLNSAPFIANIGDRGIGCTTGIHQRAGLVVGLGVDSNAITTAGDDGNRKSEITVTRQHQGAGAGILQ